MEKEARQFLIITFLLLAIAITSFVATSESIPHGVRIVAMGFTIVLAVVAVVMNLISKRQR